jgi:hypothetical protein
LDGLPPKPTINDYKKALEPFAEEIVNRYNRNVDLRNDIIIKGYVRGKTPQIVPPATPERRQPQPTLPSVIGRKTNRNYDEEEPADMETPIRQLFDDVGNVEENDNESDEEENDEGNNPPGPSPGQQEADDTVQLIQETLQQPGGGGDGNNITLGKDYFLKNDLNSNISKLEEQANKLSRLTKGLNKAINYSSSVEVQNLSDSKETLVNSYDRISRLLGNTQYIEQNFERKMSNILNKIKKQIFIIISAINGYSASNYTGGSFLSASLVPIAAQLMRGAGRDENLAYTHSSKKRFY